MSIRTGFTIIALILAIWNGTTRASVIRYYRFETDNGAAASNGQPITSGDDSSGNGLAGTLVGTPTYITSPFISPVPSTGAANQLSYLAGTNNGIFLSGSSTPVIPPTFTVEAFFRLTSADASTGDAKSILRVRDATSFPFELAILNLEGNSGNGVNDLLLEMGNDTLEIRRLDLQINTNYHVAATYDGTTVKLYLDGNLIDSSSFGFAGSGATPGGIGYDPQVPSSSYFQGQIDELRISDLARSPSQFLNSVPEPNGALLLILAKLVFVSRRTIKAGIRRS